MLTGRARGVVVGAVLAGSWRSSPPPLSISPEALADVAPLLMRTGAGGLAWWKLRHAGCARSSLARDLRATFRLQTLQARLHERRITAAVGALRSAGIEPVLAKGWAAARLYPAPGLRPYGDVDLWVGPGQLARAAAALRAARAERSRVDLHDTVPLPGRSWDDVYERSRLVPLGGDAVRVPGAEDHLALLSVHMLGHGLWRPVWLCDVAAAIESLPANFDWQRCLGPEECRAGWIGGAVRLARQLLDARGGEDVDAPQPRWLAEAVLRQWARDAHYMTTPSIAFALRRPARLATALRLRWPNAIQATVELERPFDDRPRLPLQLGDCLWRAATAARRWPRPRTAPCAK
jgi:hypothetical protein